MYIRAYLSDSVALWIFKERYAVNELTALCCLRRSLN